MIRTSSIWKVLKGKVSESVLKEGWSLIRVVLHFVCYYPFDDDDNPLVLASFTLTFFKVSEVSI